MNSYREYDGKKLKPEEPMRKERDTSVPVIRADDVKNAIDRRAIHQPQADGAALPGQALALAKQGQAYFRPDTLTHPNAPWLVAHELTHQAQQQQRGMPAGTAALEAEADQVANAVAQGQDSGVQLAASPDSALFKKDDTPLSAAPTVKRHHAIISSVSDHGSVNAGGMGLSYRFSAGGGSHQSVAIMIPEGVATAVKPVRGVSDAGYDVKNGSGTKTRTVIIEMKQGQSEAALLDVTFTRGTSSLIVTFQFAGIAPTQKAE